MQSLQFKDDHMIQKEKLEEDNMYLHDEFSSDDESIPSVTEKKLENCYEESIYLQKKVKQTVNGDILNKIKDLIRIESISK